MKLKYIFTALAATVALAAGCAKEDALKLDEVQVSQSYIAIPAEGGKVTVTVTAADEWAIDAETTPEWVAVSPAKGSKGDTEVTFTAEAATETRTANLSLTCAGRTQTIIVCQMCAKVETPVSTCAAVNAGEDSKNYRVKGVVTKIVNTTYGNWYLDDGTGEVYIYGTLDAAGGEKNFTSLGIEVGDIVDCEGPKTTYNGVVELVNVTVNAIEKSLIKVVTGAVSLPKTDSTFVVELDVKGDGISVNVPADAQSWISIRGINTADNTVTFAAAANEAGARETTLTFITTKNGKEYTAQLAVAQAGSIIDATAAEINAAEDGSTVYRLTGAITKIASGDYGNIYVADATDTVYVYGCVDANGVAYGKESAGKTPFSSLGIEVGSIVTVEGVKTSYKGDPQMKGCTITVVYSAKAATIAEVLAAADNKEQYYVVEGTVDEIANASYGNVYLTDGTNRLYVYGLLPGYGATGDAKKGLVAAKGIEVGSKIKVCGYKTSYKESPQIGGGIFWGFAE